MATAVQVPNMPNGDVAPRKDDTQAFLNGLDSFDVRPLWTQMKQANPPLPNPKAIPHVWKYDELRPQLIRAGELVSEKEAERRVLMLINPKETLEPPRTTDTIFGGLQLVLPNETAPAHRHVAFALRFIIEGNGGFTAVNGQRINMDRGDVILTPSWTWHDHGKDGSGPMIWLDGLDIPSFQHFPVHFVEHYKDPRYPADVVDKAESPIVFPWIEMKQKLDSAEGPWAAFPILAQMATKVSLSVLLGHTVLNFDLTTNKVSKTLGASAERIDAGDTSTVRRETASSVYHVIEGSGSSVIGDVTLSWKQGDTFCIPSWYQYQHFAASSSPVYLYRFDDRPMLKALGFYRAEDEVANTSLGAM